MNEKEYLQLKGIKKTHQDHKRINLTIGELVLFLREYSEISNKEISENENNKVEKYNIKGL